MKLDSVITLGVDELGKREWEKLLRSLTFIDNDGNEINAFQYRSGRDEMILPRGALDMLPAKVRRNMTDLRSFPTMPKRAYTRELDAPGYDGQRAAVEAMFRAQQGQVIAPPGRGKTEICLAFAAASRTRVLVLVHTHDLFKQWLDRAADAVPGMELGRIQGKRCEVGHLTIATAQTLKKHLHDGGKFWRQFGAIIVDEAHHAAADTWEWLLNVCPAHYRFGVTASEKRSDGRQALVRFNIGPVIYKLKFKSGVPMHVVPVQTKFRSKYNGQHYNRIMSQLVKDADRNQQIAKIVSAEVKGGHSVLVLSRRTEHLENIWNEIQALGTVDMAGVKIVTGKLTRRHRDKFIQGLRDGDIDCILGTQLFEEGVDVPRLNRIVLAFPGTEITALQKVGRGSRKFDGKTETIIYDMLDDLVRVLAKQYLRRKAWYRSVGINVEKVRAYGKKGKHQGARVRRAEGQEGGRLRDRVLRVARPGRQ